ncbi:hypothetical protein Tco_0466232 [Tanacetum coccineum]
MYSSDRDGFSCGVNLHDLKVQGSSSSRGSQEGRECEECGLAVTPEGERVDDSLRYGESVALVENPGAGERWSSWMLQAVTRVHFPLAAGVDSKIHTERAGQVYGESRLTPDTVEKDALKCKALDIVIALDLTRGVEWRTIRRSDLHGTGVLFKRER